MASAARLSRDSYLHRLGLCLEHFQSAADEAARSGRQRGGRLDAVGSDVGIHGRDCVSWPLGGGRWEVARTSRAETRRFRLSVLLGWWFSDWWRRHPDAPVVAAVSRLRRGWRDWFRTRLCFAGEHAHQVVSRPTRHGDRLGDHGLRRRSDHWCSAEGVVDVGVLSAAAIPRHGRVCRTQDGIRPAIRERRGAKTS